VAVLAGSAAHAGRLAALLPEFVVATRDAAPGSIDAMVRRLIITEARAAADPGVLDADVLFDARAAGPLDLPGFPPPARRDGRPVLLVDVADRSRPAASRRSAMRLREYRRRGWCLSTPAAKLAAPW
jgi:hypothetical protein